jgi:MFS family permease
MVGMFIGFFIWPPYSDTYGRRHIFIFTMALSTIAQGVILFTSDIHKLFLFMIVLGTTFAGKNIVALNFAIECVPETVQKFVVSIYWSVELLSIVLWSFYYQRLDKNWFPLQAIYFFFGIVVLILGIFVLPESPKYLYSKQKFTEARESLESIAKMNNIKTYSSLFVFDNEIIAEEILEEQIVQKREELLEKVQEHPDCIAKLTLAELKEIRDEEAILGKAIVGEINDRIAVL